MRQIAYREFLGNSPIWFKNVILGFLVLSLPLKMLVGTTVLGWLFLAMFILTLAMALKCYPLQSGGLLALGILAVLFGAAFIVYLSIRKEGAVVEVSEAVKKILLNYLQVVSIAAL